MSFRKNSPPLDTSKLHPALAAAVDAIEAERIRRNIGHTVLSQCAGYNAKQWRDTALTGNIRLQTLIDIAAVLGMEVEINVRNKR